MNLPVFDNFHFHTEHRSLYDVVYNINKGKIDIDYDAFFWCKEKQSRLIESLLLGIPLPSFYLAEDFTSSGNLTTIDGTQRLITLERFLNNRFRLELPNYKDLDKKTFSELTYQIQYRINNSILILHIIEESSSEEAWMEVYDRIGK